MTRTRRLLEAMFVPEAPSPGRPEAGPNYGMDEGPRSTGLSYEEAARRFRDALDVLPDEFGLDPKFDVEYELIKGQLKFWVIGSDGYAKDPHVWDPHLRQWFPANSGMSDPDDDNYDMMSSARKDEKYIGFKKLKGKLAHKKGVRDPGALAASIGRKKYGAKGMARKSAAGRRKG